jgi:hypothetical protein
LQMEMDPVTSVVKIFSLQWPMQRTEHLTLVSSSVHALWTPTPTQHGYGYAVTAGIGWLEEHDLTEEHVSDLALGGSKRTISRKNTSLILSSSMTLAASVSPIIVVLIKHPPPPDVDL